MKIKLNRGPMNGKRFETDDYAADWLVQEPVRVKDFLYGYPMHESSFEFRRGSYHKSNVVLKDGTRVFEWMGWIK